MATIKQRKAVINLVENRGNVSKAMKDAGYSEKSAHNPSNLTESKGFKELLDTWIKDEEMLKRLKGIINKGANRESLTGIDIGLKLKNRYPKEQTEIEQGEIKITIKQAE